MMDEEGAWQASVREVLAPDWDEHLLVWQLENRSAAKDTELGAIS
jgi:hypothetical protein